MRLIHFTDLHLVQGKRLDEQRRILDTAVSIAAGLGPDAWLLTGDFYGHTVPHRSTPEEREVLFAAVARMADVAPVVALYGNHDYPRDLHPLANLGGELGWPVRVVDAGGELDVPTPCGRTLHLYALPYPRSTWVLQGADAPKTAQAADAEAAARLGRVLRLWGATVRARRAVAPGDAHVLIAHANVAGSATAGGEVMSGREVDLSAGDIDAGGFDYGALGHIHLRQEVALRAWYAGTLWRNDFSETDGKGWHLIDVDVSEEDFEEPTFLSGGEQQVLAASTKHYADGERHRVAVRWIRTDPRDRITLRYRWAADTEDGAPRWVTRPNLDEHRLLGAEVRAMLVVPSQWATTCPWEEELAELRRRMVHDIEAYRTTEPSARVRAPAVAEAQTDEAALRAYWTTLGTEVVDTEQAEALRCLAELCDSSDEAIAAKTSMLLGAAS